MRQKRTLQTSIFDVFVEHEIGRELQAMSELLDAHRKYSTASPRIWAWTRAPAGAG